MTPEDIANTSAEFKRVHGATPSVLRSQSLADIDQHQSDLNTVIGGLDSLVTFYDGLVKHYQNLRDEAKDDRKKLERDFDDSKRAYWRVKSEGDRTRIEPPTPPQS